MKTPSMLQRFSAFFLAVLLGTAPALLRAQPSGGPYGPQPRIYEVPADAAHVYYVAPDAREEASGRTLDEPTTLESAIARVVTGDVIILRGGVYRTGGLVLNQGVTLQPYRDEMPVLKGTRVATEWEALNDGVWRTRWQTLFPMKPQGWWRKNREGMRTPLHRFNNDMVFVDGRPLQSAHWEGGLDENSYAIDYENGYVFIRLDPAGREIEITAHDSALTRITGEVHGKVSDKRGYTLRGLTFTQYAYRALEVEGRRGTVPDETEPTDEPIGLADPATYGKEVVGTTLEDVTITHCSRVAGYFRGDGFTLRRCFVSDTSTEGIYVIGSSNCLLEKNIFTRNNVEKITGYYPAAVKIFNQSHRVVCRDNLVIDNPDSNGIWYDVGNRDGVFVNNWIENCQDGFFFEISKGAICAGNVFVDCDSGIRVLNSADVRVYRNTFVNSTATFERNERSADGDHFGWHITTGPDVDKRDGHVFTENVLLAGAGFNRPLLRVHQAAALKGKLTRAQLTASAANVYVRAPDAGTAPLATWSPAENDAGRLEFADIATFQEKLPAFERGSRLMIAPLHAIVKSPELKNFQLVRAFGIETEPASVLPREVAEAAGWSSAKGAAPGAYPAGL